MGTKSKKNKSNEDDVSVQEISFKNVQWSDFTLRNDEIYTVKGVEFKKLNFRQIRSIATKLKLPNSSTAKKPDLIKNLNQAYHNKIAYGREEAFHCAGQ